MWEERVVRNRQGDKEVRINRCPGPLWLIFDDCFIVLAFAYVEKFHGEMLQPRNCALIHHTLSKGIAEIANELCPGPGKESAWSLYLREGGDGVGGVAQYYFIKYGGFLKTGVRRTYIIAVHGHRATRIPEFTWNRALDVMMKSMKVFRFDFRKHTRWEANDPVEEGELTERWRESEANSGHGEW